jgi:hypothetical protein
MFVRYLGGGIGHLEQFPPANNDNGATYEYEGDSEDEVIGDGSGTGSDEKDGDEEDEEDGEDSEVAEDDEHSDPGESSDEDMGNVY